MARVDKLYQSTYTNVPAPTKAILASFRTAALALAEKVTDPGAGVAEFDAAKKAVTALVPVIKAAEAYAGELKRIDALCDTARSKVPEPQKKALADFRDAAVAGADAANAVDTAAAAFTKAKQALTALEPACSAGTAYAAELTRVTALVAPVHKAADNGPQKVLDKARAAAVGQADAADATQVATAYTEARQKLTNLGSSPARRMPTRRPCGPSNGKS